MNSHLENEFQKSSNFIIPILRNFSLHMKKIDTPNYRNIPMTANDYGKITKSFLYKKLDSSLFIFAFSWRNEILVKYTYLNHFHEILLAYIHNHLSFETEYIILNQSHKFGIRITINPKSKQLDIEKFDSDKNKFMFIESISKLECRILVRLIFKYTNNGEILESEDDFDGSTKCNYSNNPFFLKVLL